MEQRPIEGILNITLDKIKAMADANTIIGDEIVTADGTVIIPVSKINYGFASGGSDLPSKKENAKNLFAGGSGAGLTVTPVAFICISNGDVKLLQIQPYTDSSDRAISMIPEVIDKISGLFKKNKEEDNKKDEKSSNNDDSNQKPVL